MGFVSLTAEFFNGIGAKQKFKQDTTRKIRPA
jgi:hypothetical protein